ncbi:hypothetical protein HDU76_002109 [Blyttiomyces sp. JEL0837]|nr:hypothetical protein HDU76_002109 [Blyttiomyces sp. JEL0837]
MASNRPRMQLSRRKSYSLERNMPGQQQDVAPHRASLEIEPTSSSSSSGSRFYYDSPGRKGEFLSLQPATDDDDEDLEDGHAGGITADDQDIEFDDVPTGDVGEQEGEEDEEDELTERVAVMALRSVAAAHGMGQRETERVDDVKVQDQGLGLGSTTVVTMNVRNVVKDDHGGRAVHRRGEFQSSSSSVNVNVGRGGSSTPATTTATSSARRSPRPGQSQSQSRPRVTTPLIPDDSMGVPEERSGFGNSSGATSLLTPAATLASSNSVQPSRGRVGAGSYSGGSSRAYIPTGGAGGSSSQVKASDRREEKGDNHEDVLIMPQACLFVANLNSSRSDEQLYESCYNYFRHWGELFSVKVHRDANSRPSAFVQYYKIADAKRATAEAPQALLDGRMIRIEQANVNRTLFVKFSSSLKYDSVMGILEKWGPIEDFTLLHDRETGFSKGCGFAKYFSREDAIKAFLGIRRMKKWTVDWATKVDRTKDLDTNSIFVGKINQDQVTLALLRERFSKYGEIEHCELYNRPPPVGATRPAFAFVRFTDEKSAEIAIEEENGSRWLDRIIKVQYREVDSQRESPVDNNSANINTIPQQVQTWSLQPMGGQPFIPMQYQPPYQPPYQQTAAASQHQQHQQPIYTSPPPPTPYQNFIASGAGQQQQQQQIPITSPVQPPRGMVGVGIGGGGAGAPGMSGHGGSPLITMAVSPGGGMGPMQGQFGMHSQGMGLEGPGTPGHQQQPEFMFEYMPWMPQFQGQPQPQPPIQPQPQGGFNGATGYQYQQGNVGRPPVPPMQYPQQQAHQQQAPQVQMAPVSWVQQQQQPQQQPVPVMGMGVMGRPNGPGGFGMGYMMPAGWMLVPTPYPYYPPYVPPGGAGGPSQQQGSQQSQGYPNARN